MGEGGQMLVGVQHLLFNGEEGMLISFIVWGSSLAYLLKV